MHVGPQSDVYNHPFKGECKDPEKGGTLFGECHVLFRGPLRKVMFFGFHVVLPVCETTNTGKVRA